MWHEFSGTSIMQNGRDKFYFYSVDKEKELYPMKLEGIEEFFSTLDKLGKKAFGNAVVLFDGYNDITTELYEIPEVRNFVKEMFDRFPYLLNYINFDLEGHHWLLSCLVDVDTVYGGEKLTFDEHIKRYGIHTPMPRFYVHMNMPQPLLNHLRESMLRHGRNHNAFNKALGQVSRLSTIFSK